MNKRKLYLSLLITGLLVFSAVYIFKVKDEMVDFEVNYVAGARIRAGETLYRAEDDHYQFKYSPFSALLYLPFSSLPLDTAKAFWYFIIIFSTASLLFISWKMVIPQGKNSSVTLVLTFIILIRYFLRELQLGQINSMITLILILMIWSMTGAENHPFSSRRNWSAGLLWGLATALKPYSLIFFPYFLLKKKWKTLCSGALFLAFSFIVPSYFYGIKGNLLVHKEWKSSLSVSTPTLLDSQDNVSILGFAMKWTKNLNVSLIIYALTIAVIAVFLLIIIMKGSRIQKSTLLESSILLLLIPLISPLGWDYTLLSSTLGVMIILRFFSKYPKFWRVLIVVNFLIIFFSLYDILGSNLYSQFMSWSVITLNFLVLAFFLSYLRIKKYG